MTERQQEYIKILAAEIENENVRVVYSPFRAEHGECIEIIINRKGSDRKVAICVAVPDREDYWQKEIEVIRRRINREYQESIV